MPILKNENPSERCPAGRGRVFFSGFFSLFGDPHRAAVGNCVGGKIPIHKTHCSHHRVRTDCNSRHDHRMATDPGVPPNHHFAFFVVDRRDRIDGTVGTKLGKIPYLHTLLGLDVGESPNVSAFPQNKVGRMTDDPAVFSGPTMPDCRFESFKRSFSRR